MKNTRSIDVEVNIISPERNEYVKIGCHKKDERIEEITQFIKTRQGNIEGWQDGDCFNVPIPDIFYVEAVDDRTFFYLLDETYESRRRLYELEEVMEPYNFIRISKSVVVNLMKIVSIKPALNGRFLCKLKNGEEVVISRKYVPDIKKKLRGDRS